MTYRPDESRAAKWIRAHPLVGWLAALLIILVCFGALAVLAWAKSAGSSASDSILGEMLKGAGVVGVALFAVLRARRDIRP